MAQRLALAVATTVIATLGVLLPAPAHAAPQNTQNLRGTSWELVGTGLDMRGTSWE